MSENATSNGNANTGTLLEIKGVVVDAVFPNGLPEIYSALRIARPDPGTVVIGSTGFGNLEWQPLPPESVTAVSLHDLSVRVLPLVAD